METLADFLKEQPGYRLRGSYLLRPNGSVAVEFLYAGFRSNPTEKEFFMYMVYCGRCLPSLLCERDLTNMGHA